MTDPEKKKARRTRRSKAAAGGDGVVAPAVVLPEHAVALVAVAVKAFDDAEAELLALEAKHQGVVYAVDTHKGLTEARAARYELRLLRYAVQNRLADTITAMENTKAGLKRRAGSLIARLTPLEQPIDVQIKVREDAIEQERLRKERELAERNARIETILAKVRGLAFAAIGADLTQLQANLVELDDLADINAEVFGTRLGEGEEARTQARAAIVLLIERERVLEAERAETRRQNEERAAKRREADEAAATERRQIAAAREQLERDKRTLEAERDRQRGTAPPPAPAPTLSSADLNRMADEAVAHQHRLDAQANPGVYQDYSDIFDMERLQAATMRLANASAAVYWTTVDNQELLDAIPGPLMEAIDRLGALLLELSTSPNKDMGT